MRNATARFRPAVEDNHVPLPKLLQHIQRSLQIRLGQKVCLSLKVPGMQDHLRPQPAVLVQNELVIRLDLTDREFRVIVQKTRFPGFVVGVKWFNLCYW